MDFERTENWIRHYDILLWTVTSLLLATNTFLFSSLIKMKSEFFLLRVAISAIGLFLTVITVYFAASFRKLRHAFIDKYHKDAQQSEDEKQYANDIEKIYQAGLKQWTIYIVIFWAIAVAWIIWPIFLKETNYIYPICVIFTILITVLFFILHKIGMYKKFIF